MSQDPDWMEKTRQRVIGVFLRWRYLLYLNLWRVDFVWDSGTGPDNGKNMCGLMEVDAVWEYRKAIITVWCGTVRTLNDEDLEAAVLHELVHCLVCEMRDWDEDHKKHEESVVGQVTSALLATLRAGREEGWSAKPGKKKPQAPRARR